MSRTQQAEMRTALFEYIQDRGGVTYIELCRDVTGFAGDDTAEGANNVIFWQGVNLDAYNALKGLMADGLIEPVGTSPLTYAADGALLALPIAKRLNKAYARPHWFPLVFNAVR